MEGPDEISSLVIFRVIDANANRCAEGLRVIEEIARFSLEDDPLFREIKDIRHSVRRTVESVLSRPGRFRDSEGDVGAALSTRSESSRDSLDSVRRANFLRAEESLRVLEEFGKLLDPVAAARFKNLRFRLYSAEKYFAGDAGKRGKIPVPPFLYAFIDRKFTGPGESGTTAASLVAGGADMIQYRAKRLGREEMRSDILAALRVCGPAGVPLVVNDDPELAVETGADGAHIGSTDGDPLVARAILGPGSILGLSIATMEEFSRAPLDAVDYIGVGAVYDTGTKEDVETVGLEFLERMCAVSPLPVVAIGGIGIDTIGEVFDAGAAGAAVVSWILKGDVRKNCFTLKEIIDRRRRGGE